MAKPMIDMEQDDEAIGDMVMPIPAPRSSFPYGLRICLTGAEMDKLGLDAADAFVDGILHLHAMARITCVSSEDRAEGPPSRRVELQIESMAVEGEDEENSEQERVMSKRNPLYDRTK